MTKFPTGPFPLHFFKPNENLYDKFHTSAIQMKTLKTPLTIRSDLYCPLPFSLDAYWNCLVDCHHCYFRHLNHTWGTDLRPANPLDVYKKLKNGLNNKNPKSYLAWAIKRKKTLRFGNKTDPFQPAEKEHRVSLRLLKVLNRLSWSTVIQTRCTWQLMEYEDVLMKQPSLWTVMPVISPGFVRDWEILEKKCTTPPDYRLIHLQQLLRNSKGKLSVGVNGEPFIPGFHTIKEFSDTVRILKSYGIRSYNTYNFHFNAFVAKRLHAIGIDIEKIWYYNQDARWKKILAKLLRIADKEGIVLGCPDFVNSGSKWYEKANTCCGINVENPLSLIPTFGKSNYKRGKIQETF
jgi:DNA repair photolyase